ncbi:MAG: carbohydrate kinase family protein [Halobacteriaceae archaeon]
MTDSEPAEPAAPMVVAGDAVIDLVAADGATIEEATTFRRFPGGSGLNVAACLGLLESPVSMLTTVADDPFGEALRGHLRSLGVDTAPIRKGVGRTTLTVAEPAGASEPTWLVYPGTEPPLAPADCRSVSLDPVEWLHVTGVTLATGPARRATLTLVDRAAAADATVSFDLNARPSLWDDPGPYREAVREVLASADVAIAARGDLRAMDLPLTPDLAGPALREAGPTQAILTRGSEGAVGYSSEGGPVTRPGFEVDAVDTAGAGDAFAAGFIAARRATADLGEALTAGNAVAATAVRTVGAHAGVDPAAVATLLPDLPW